MMKHQGQNIAMKVFQKKQKTSAISNFMPQILPDDEIAEAINPLNSKRKEVINAYHTWAKNWKTNGKHDGHNIWLVRVFLSDSRGTDQSYLMKLT